MIQYYPDEVEIATGGVGEDTPATAATACRRVSTLASEVLSVARRAGVGVGVGDGSDGSRQVARWHRHWASCVATGFQGHKGLFRCLE